MTQCFLLVESGGGGGGGGGAGEEFWWRNFGGHTHLASHLKKKCG